WVRDTGSGLIWSSLLFPAVTAAVGLLLYGFLASGERWHIGLGAVLVAASLFVAGMLLVSLESARKDLASRVPELNLTLPSGRRGWIEVYASHDVVPMGGGSLLRAAPFVARAETTSDRSYVGDH